MIERLPIFFHSSALRVKFYTYLLPAGNLLISICFSLGSISGPFLGGLAIEHLPNISFFFLISCILFLIFFGLAGFKEEKQLPLADQRWNF
ncbi:MAG: hypothetical protein WAW77_15695 [Caldibacillus thermoamylovorans]